MFVARHQSISPAATITVFYQSLSILPYFFEKCKSKWRNSWNFFENLDKAAQKVYNLCVLLRDSGLQAAPKRYRRILWLKRIRLRALSGAENVSKKVCTRSNCWEWQWTKYFGNRNRAKRGATEIARHKEEQFLWQWYTEGYRSGHNEAVLKNYRSDLCDLRKTLDFTGVLAIFFALCEKAFSQFSRTFHNWIFGIYWFGDQF